MFTQQIYVLRTWNTVNTYKTYWNKSKWVKSWRQTMIWKIKSKHWINICCISSVFFCPRPSTDPASILLFCSLLNPNCVLWIPAAVLHFALLERFGARKCFHGQNPENSLLYLFSCYVPSNYTPENEDFEKVIRVVEAEGVLIIKSLTFT